MDETEGMRGRSTPVIASMAAVWLIWGSTYLAIKIGLETMSPFFMQGVRFVFGATLVIGWLRWQGSPWPTRRQMTNAAVIGVLLLVGGLGLVTLAEDRGIDTGLVATIIAIQPMLMSFWGALWRVWPTGREWLGMTIGLVGVVILVADDGLAGSVGGIVLVFVASMNWSFGSTLSRRLDMPSGAWTTGLEMGAAAIVHLLISLARTERVVVPSARSSLAVAYLVVFGSVVAFSAFTYLIANVRAPRAMSYAYVNPAIAVLLGVIFSDESVSAHMALALPVILIGVAIVTNSARMARAE